MKIFLFLVPVLFCCYQSLAQQFIKNNKNQPLTLKEMQIQFKDWSQTHDINQEKHWKYFKRWEMDMLMHSNSNGEPGNKKEYIDAVVNAALEKNKNLNQKSFTDPWYPIGPDVIPENQTGYMENGIGRINCIAFHPTSTSTFFAGVAQGGLWKTTNNGQSWTPLTDNLPITRISDITVDQTNPDVMYISVCDFEYVGIGLYLDGRKRNTHYGLGVYKTINGGQSWQPTGLSFQLTDGDASLIRKVLIDPSNSNKLVACGVSGMYKSSDAGTTWSKTLDSLFWDLVPDPVNSNTLYAATGWVQNADDGNAAIYKSTDFGNSWIKLNSNIPPTDSVQRIKIAISPSDPNYIYAVAVNTDNGLYGIYKSTDAGSSWEFIDPGVNILDAFQGSSTSGQGTYDLAVLVNATNKNALYVGGVNLWGSTDGGFTFNPISHWTFEYGPTVHGDIHYLDRQTSTGNIFVCSDGGIYRTSNIVIGSWYDANMGVPWPTQWTNLSDGLAITSFYRISSSRNTKGRLAAGSQDNATFYYDGTSWSTVFGGDGMDNYLDPQNDQSIMGSSQYGNFYVSNDNGINWSGINANMNNEDAEWTSPLVADYNQYGTLYSGFVNVYKSTDGGTNWNSISQFPTGFNNNEISALAVSNSNGNIIYAAKRVRHEYQLPGALYKTVDGGTSWVDITSGLPDSLYFTSVEISELYNNTVYVSVAGLSTGKKVFKTSNGGSNWTNISYNLPNIPVNCVKNIPGTNDIIIATDIGVYVLEENSTIWKNMSAGLPNVIVSDIEFNAELNKIYVCTFGRGIWAADMNFLYTGNKNSIKPAQTIQLFPTLNNGSFTIQSPQPVKVILLEIIDIKGRLISSELLSGRNTYQVKKQLLPGLYFARLLSEQNNQVIKFVVE